MEVSVQQAYQSAKSHTFERRGEQRLGSSWPSHEGGLSWPWGAPIAVISFGATDESSSPSWTTCSRFPLPSARRSCLWGLPGGGAQAPKPGGPSPWIPCLLRLGLLHLSIYCQSWTRKHQETLQCIICTWNVVLCFCCIQSSFLLMFKLITSAKMVTLLASWSFDTGAKCSGLLSHLGTGIRTFLLDVEYAVPATEGRRCASSFVSGSARWKCKFITLGAVSWRYPYHWTPENLLTRKKPLNHKMPTLWSAYILLRPSAFSSLLIWFCYQDIIGEVDQGDFCRMPRWFWGRITSVNVYYCLCEYSVFCLFFLVRIERNMFARSVAVYYVLK